MEVEQMLKELAGAEAPLEMRCDIPACNCGGTHATGPMRPLFPWARAKCKPFIPPCPHIEVDCPGWRTAQLDEIDLDWLMKLYAMKVEPTHVGWKTGHPPWKAKPHDSVDWTEHDTPTEAAIAAVYEATKMASNLKSD